MNKYMDEAIKESLKSQDPNTKVGAVIVKEGKIVSKGHNAFPNEQENFPTTREGAWLKTKYPFIVHAEMNAIMNSKTDVKDSVIYTTLFPCNECAKNIATAKIKEVYYLDDKYKDTDSVIAAKIIFEKSGVKYERIN